MELLIFLVFMLPKTEYPTVVFMRPFDSFGQCYEFRDNLPKEARTKFDCIGVVKVKPDAKEPVIM